MAWVPAESRLAQRDSVPLSAFETEPYIETYPNKDIDNKRVFEKYNIKPNLKFSTMDSLATGHMVEAGLGICMNNKLNSLFSSPDIKLMPLLPPQTVQIGIASLKDKTPAAETFFNFMLNFEKEFC